MKTLSVLTLTASLGLTSLLSGCAEQKTSCPEQAPHYQHFRPKFNVDPKYLREPTPEECALMKEWGLDHLELLNYEGLRCINQDNLPADFYLNK